jgi:hypothetical protein
MYLLDTNHCTRAMRGPLEVRRFFARRWYADRGAVVIRWEEAWMTTVKPRVPRQTTEDGDRPRTSDTPTKATGGFEGPAYAPAKALLAHFGNWVGDDLEELLEEVYETRSKVSW